MIIQALSEKKDKFARKGDYDGADGYQELINLFIYEMKKYGKTN